MRDGCDKRATRLFFSPTKPTIGLSRDRVDIALGIGRREEC
jgi:hypothetical protein